MSKSIFSFSEGIVYVSEKQLTQGPNTPGQPRKTAYEEEGLWTGVTTVTAEKEPSQWHHHMDHDSIMYMINGTIRVDWGDEGEKSFMMGPGDFAFFRRGVIHRAQIVESDGECKFVVVRLGSGDTVKNVDGPGQNVIDAARAAD